MAISVLEVRDTVVPQHVRVPAAAAASSDAVAPRRLPLTVVGAAVVGVLEAVALLAVALGGLDGLLTAAGRPAGWLVAVGLVVLAGWIVLCAGSAAAMVDGTGRSLVQGVAYAEMGLVALLLVVATANAFTGPTPLPLPA